MTELTPANLASTAIRTMSPAIVERLRLAFPDKIFGIERVPSMLNGREFNEVTRKTPFIGLSWVGMKKDSDSGRLLKGHHQWQLTLVVQASGSLRVRYEGDHSDIGIDAMIDVAVALLQGATLEDIGSVTVTDAKSVFAQGLNDDDIALAHIYFDVSFTAPLQDLALVNAASLNQMQITWSTTQDGDPDDNTQTIQSQNEGA